MAAGEWGTPTITHRTGQFIRHTSIVATCELDGTNIIPLELSNMPYGVYAGMVQARVDGGTASEQVRLRIRCIPSGLGATPNASDIYAHNHTLSTDPDYFPIYSLFEQVQAPASANNQICHFALPSNDFRIYAEHSVGVSTTDTVTLYIGMLSHVLDQK